MSSHDLGIGVGEVQRGRYAEARQALAAAAKLGDADGWERDLYEALHWYRRAGELG
jgi:hypothetical protein